MQTKRSERRGVERRLAEERQETRERDEMREESPSSVEGPEHEFRKRTRHVFEFGSWLLSGLWLDSKLKKQ